MDYTTNRYIPTGANKVANKSGSAVAYLYTTKTGRLCALGYVGKAGKSALNYSYRNNESRMKSVGQFLRDADACMARKSAAAAEKKAKMAKPTGLKLGDVLSCVWGYEQTNVEYFEVTKIVGRRTVEIRKIGSMAEATGYDTGVCAPCKGSYLGEPMRKLVNQYDGVKIYEFANASKIEPIKVGGVEVFGVQRFSSYA